MKSVVMRLLCLCLLMLSASCNRMPDTLIHGGYDEEEMDAAVARARSEVDDFIAAMQQGNGTDFAVKVPVEDRDEIEHFWLTDVSYQDGQFHGRIGNDPGIVTNVRFGQEWTIGKAEISDWMYLRDDLLYGNYTMRPLLGRMKKEDAEFWKARFAVP